MCTSSACRTRVPAGAVQGGRGGGRFGISRKIDPDKVGKNRLPTLPYTAWTKTYLYAKMSNLVKTLTVLRSANSCKAEDTLETNSEL